MRPFVYIILTIYVLTVLYGIYIIFKRNLHKTRNECHYNFHYFSINSKEGYALDDENGKHMYYAVKTKEELDHAVFKFTNGANRLSSSHRVSGPGYNSDAPNYSYNSFLFDKDDIWVYLKDKGIDIKTTIFDDTLTRYNIKLDSKPIAFVKKAPSETTNTEGANNNELVYTMRTYEKNLGLLFITLFAIIKTEQAKEIFEAMHAEKTKQEEEKVNSKQSSKTAEQIFNGADISLDEIL